MPDLGSGGDVGRDAVGEGCGQDRLVGVDRGEDVHRGHRGAQKLSDTVWASFRSPLGYSRAAWPFVMRQSWARATKDWSKRSGSGLVMRVWSASIAVRTLWRRDSSSSLRTS